MSHQHSVPLSMRDNQIRKSASTAPRRYLFLDDEHITRLRALRRILCQPKPYPGNPVLRPGRPWEIGGISHYGMVLFDDNQKLFRFWYFSHAAVGGTRSTVNIDGRSWLANRGLLCYATSKDGLSWERPDLGQVEFEGSKHNNIAFSSDGIHWTNHDTNPIIPRDSDTQLVVSRDGVHWVRVGDRQPFLPLGPEGSWSDGMVMSTAQWITRGDEVYIFHGMVNGPHAGPKHPMQQIRENHAKHHK